MNLISKETPSYVYLGLPRTGSTYIHNIIPHRSKGHEVLMSQYLQSYKAFQESKSDTEYIGFIQRRSSILRFKYDIFTMHSLSPSILIRALPATRIFACIREPIEWSRSMCSYLLDILNISKHPISSQLIANAFFKHTIPCISIHSFTSDITSKCFQQTLLDQLISFWLSRTLDLLTIANQVNSFIVCLDECAKHLPDLFNFLGLDQSMLPESIILQRRVNQSSYCPHYSPFLFSPPTTSPDLEQAQELYHSLKQEVIIVNSAHSSVIDTSFNSKHHGK